MKTLFTILALMTAVIIIAIITNEPTPGPIVTRSIEITVSDDGSGTVKDWPQMGHEPFEKMISIIEQKGGGSLYVFDVAEKVPKPITCHIEPLIVEPGIYEADEAKIKGIREKNQKIKAANNLAKESFIRELNERNEKHPNKSKDDFSYVNRTFREVINTVKLISTSDSECYTFIYSDLINDVPGSKVEPIDSSLIAELNQLKTKIVLCSYDPPERVEQLNCIRVSSFNEFTNVIK